MGTQVDDTNFSTPGYVRPIGSLSIARQYSLGKR